MLKDLFKEKTLIVIPGFGYSPALLQFKNAHPDLEIKIIDRETLIDKISIKFKKDPIPFLMVEKNIEYSKAKKYVQLLRVADVTKNAVLNDLYTSLLNDYIDTDSLGLYEISRYKNLYLFDMENDIEIKSLLNRNGLTAKDLDFKDIQNPFTSPYRLGEEWGLEKPNIIYFQNKFLQYFYIFSDIRRRLDEDESLVDKISLLVDDGDEFYVKLASSVFKIPCFLNIRRPFKTQPEIKNKISEILNSKSFDFDVPEGNEILKDLSLLIEKYRLKEIPDFTNAYSNLLEIITSYTFTDSTDNKGVEVTSKFIFNPTKIIYVTNFRHGSFYKVYSDNNVLTDKELEEVFANPSYVKTKMDKKSKENYIFFNNIAMLTRVKQHLTDSIYDSQFVSEFKWFKESEKDKLEPKDIINAIIKEETYNLNGKYSIEAYNIINADSYDKAFMRAKYEEKNDTYDHSFKGIRGNVYTPYEGNWSATKLENYVLCPFKFYLEQLIPAESDKHAAWRGVLLHKVMETIYREHFDFDIAFEEGKKEYLRSMKRNHAEMTPKEEAYLEVIKHWAKSVCDVIRSQINNGMNIIYNEQDAERKVYYTLTDEFGNKYPFVGTIDKIVWTKNGNTNYYTIVDYKSGNERFVPEGVCVGASTQLPLYYAAINDPTKKNNVLTNNGEFGGILIKPIYKSTIKKIFASDGIISYSQACKNLKMDGLTLGSVKYWESIDKTAIKTNAEKPAKTGTYVKYGITFGGADANELLVKDTTLLKYNFNDLIEDAKKSSIATIKKIMANNFEIKPTTSDVTKFDMNNLACKYCPFKDVCYHDAKDAYDYTNEIRERFHPPVDESENKEIEETVEEA